MIAKIYNIPNVNGVAVLSFAGVWACPDKEIEEVLNVLFSPLDTMRGPAHGFWGYPQATMAAEKLGAKVEFTDKRGAEPGGGEVVY